MNIYKNGVYDITNEEYHASNGVSRSSLMTLKKSPYHYWYEYISQKCKVKDTTQAIKIGSAVHTYVLENNLFDDRYFISKKIDKRTSAGKEEYNNMIKVNAGKEAIDEEEFKLIKSMRDSIKNHDQASKLIENAKIEKSIYWTDPDTDIMCKVRPDIWHEKMIVDLKTTQSASYRDFQSSCYKYGYHIQAAMIQEAFKHALGQKMDNFIFIAIEKEEPYALALYMLDESAIKRGVDEFRVLLNKLKENQEKNEWPMYETQVMTLPGYAINEII